MPEDTTRLKRSLTLKTAEKVDGQDCKVNDWTHNLFVIFFHVQCFFRHSIVGVSVGDSAEFGWLQILQMTSVVEIWQRWEHKNRDLLDPINYWLLWNDLE